MAYPFCFKYLSTSLKSAITSVLRTSLRDCDGILNILLCGTGLAFSIVQRLVLIPDLLRNLLTAVWDLPTSFAIIFTLFPAKKLDLIVAISSGVHFDFMVFPI